MRYPKGAFLILISLLPLGYTGCQTYQLGGVDRTKYLVLEDKTIKEFSVVGVLTGQAVPIVPAPGSWTIAFVPADRMPNTRSSHELSSVVNKTPDHRILMNNNAGFTRVIREMTNDLPKETPRWLVSIDPLVIGIEDRSRSEFPLLSGAHLSGEMRVELGANTHLIEEANLDLTIRQLIVITDIHFDDLRLKRAASKRAIPVRRGTALRQILAEPPWLGKKDISSQKDAPTTRNEKHQLVQELKDRLERVDPEKAKLWMSFDPDGRLIILNISQLPIDNDLIERVSTIDSLVKLSITLNDRSLHLEPLARLKRLRALTLQGAPPDEGYLSWINSESKLKELYLFECKGISKNIQHIVSVQNLEHLGLSGTDVSDDDVERLTNMNKLTVLDLAFTNVSDKIVPSLSRMRALEIVMFHDTRVSEPGRAKLRELRPDVDHFTD